MTEPSSSGGAAMPFPASNTHVHIPPNFSTDEHLDRLLLRARSEGLRAIGTSNFFDMQVFPRFVERARACGLHPLLGIEIITVDAELETRGWTVNDPQNPGRYYLQGRGLSLPRASAMASETAMAIRTRNDERAELQVQVLSELFAGAGLEQELTAAGVTARVAAGYEVPQAWVSLQERHIARAFADALCALGEAERASVLERAYGRPPTADLKDPGSVQTELRGAFMKAGQPGFVPDSPTTFADAHAMVLELGGFPTYCAVADGVSPVCDYEQPATELAHRIRDRNIHAAELITVRNTVRCVDEYVAAFREAGLVVMAGTEHNTPHRLPLATTCVDGPASEPAAAAFWEGACIVAAHQELVSRGETGFVDRNGELAAACSRRRELAEYGAELISS